VRAPALILAGALACGAGAWSAPALAVMDPARAQADVDAAMRAHAYTFCRAPHEPLSPDAIELCPHASAIPDCAGYATACAKTTPPSWKLPSWWGMFSLPPFLGVLFQVLMWLVVAALVLAILVPVVAAIVRYRRRDEARAKKADKPRVAEPVPLAELVATSDEQALLASADELVARGEYAAALQLYLAAGLRALDKRGAVRITKDRTNGEYVRSCADAASKPALRDIVREVDRVQFGGEQATREAASRAAQRAIAIVKAVPLALLVVLLPLVLGCSGASFKPRVSGDDPAGGELLRDVLRAQGVTVKGLDSALASLPVPTAGERTPAVIVDVEQTSLDDDTRAHLARWVEAGGILVLAGSSTQWPKEFGASYASTTGPRKITARRLLARAVEPEPGEEDDGDTEEDSTSAIYARTEEHAIVTTDRGLKFKGASEEIAWFDDHTTYAAVVGYGMGRVLCIATDELLTNAGIAHPGNSAALVAILAATSRSEMRIADPEDGVSPPSTPIAALLRAGLGTGLLHAVPFVVVLFLGAGTRLSRPKPAPPPRRRAFAEHVTAVGALYARTHNGAHALAAYARFADERLRARMPRGSMDVGGFLASRAGMPLDVCQRLWARAMQAKAGAPPLGDELSVLRELSVVYAAAMQQER
jgi:hypothetical protein